MITQEQELKIRERVKVILAKDMPNDEKEVEIAKAMIEETAEAQA